MHLTLTEKQRGPSALLSYAFSGEMRTIQQQVQAIESEESVIDNLVAVKTKVEKVEGKISKYTSSMAYMSLNTGKNEKLILRVSCENPLRNEKWICTEDEDWSDWQEIGVIDLEDYSINDETYMFNLQINISVRKIEKPELCTKMFLDDDFTDFSLSASNGSVAVHKIVMASHSDVFKAMLNGEWKETIEGRVEVKGTTRECLEHLKDYMYLDVIPDEGLCPLLLLALRYMIGNLKTRCIGKLADSVTAENLYEILDFACLNNIPELTHEILHSTPSEIVDKAYKLKSAKKSPGLKTLAIPESVEPGTDSK